MSTLHSTPSGLVFLLPSSPDESAVENVMNLLSQEFASDPTFEEECVRKLTSVAAMPPFDMNTGLTHSAGPESSPLKGNDLLAQILPLV